MTGVAWLGRMSPWTVCGVAMILLVAIPRPSPAEGPCRLPVKANHPWLPQEVYVWEQTCKGEPADLEAKFGGDAPARDASNWPESRRLRAVFIATMIGAMPANPSTSKGVRVRGALVREPLSLSDVNIAYPLVLKRSRFEGAVDLSGARASAAVSFTESFFWDDVTMTMVNVWSYLDFNGATFDHGLVLNGARIGGPVFLNEVQATGTFDMRRMVTGGNVEFESAVLEGDLDLQHASIGGALFLSGSESGKQAEFFGRVNAAGIRVGNLIDLSRSYFDSQVDLSRATAANVLTMRNSFVRSMSAVNAKFADGDVDVRGTRFCALDLSGSRVGMALRLGRPQSALDGCPGVLNLSGANVSRLEDIENDWPARVDLPGLQYSYISSDGRDSRWFLEKWLARGQYSPQPYEQLASVLRASGRAEDAADVLYASKVKEQQRRQGLAWLWSVTQDLLIGFGFRLERALWPCLGFVIVGALVVRASGQGRRMTPAAWVVYSVDSLLPLVKLREGEESVALGKRGKYYFYVHRIAGWILASFLVAGLSGLTK